MSSTKRSDTAGIPHVCVRGDPILSASMSTTFRQTLESNSLLANDSERNVNHAIVRLQRQVDFFVEQLEGGSKQVPTVLLCCFLISILTDYKFKHCDYFMIFNLFSCNYIVLQSVTSNILIYTENTC